MARFLSVLVRSMLGSALFIAANFSMAATSGLLAQQSSGNRLTYLDGNDLYYVSRSFPRLVTPQWIGEESVDFVVTLAIDDMRKPDPWVPFLEPTMDRLKQAYGRAPLSIMTVQVDPGLDTWQRLLKDGVSLECHTYDHPCPVLKGGRFADARRTYERCIDGMHEIPGNRPLAFRVPCCDSRNTPSPRFYAEIFNKTNTAGRFLRIDSSVFNVITPNDPEVPRELVIDKDDRQKYRKYLPFPSFVNTIDDYPYPYVIGRLCWEFPCVTPSDWAGQNLVGAGNPQLIEDLKAAMDVTAIKRGTYNLVFHPYGWSRSEQIAELVSYALDKYADRVRFLSFRECHERLTENMLSGEPLRSDDGSDNGVRLLDLNADGYMDVVAGNDRVRWTRVWNPQRGEWIQTTFPVQIVRRNDQDVTEDQQVRFGVLQANGYASFLVKNANQEGLWHFDGQNWQPQDNGLDGLADNRGPVATGRDGIDLGVRFRDVDYDGKCELLVSNPQSNRIFDWNDGRWTRTKPDIPPQMYLVDDQGRDDGLRFVDINADGYDDLVYSNERRYQVVLYTPPRKRWTRPLVGGNRRNGDANPIPMITRQGTNNGAWFHSGHLWVQNEDTARMPDLVDRRSFAQLMGKAE